MADAPFQSSASPRQKWRQFSQRLLPAKRIRNLRGPSDVEANQQRASQPESAVQSEQGSAQQSIAAVWGDKLRAKVSLPGSQLLRRKSPSDAELSRQREAALSRLSDTTTHHGQQSYLPPSADVDQAVQALLAEHTAVQQQLQASRSDAEASQAAQLQLEQQMLSMQQNNATQLQSVTSNLQSQLEAARQQASQDLQSAQLAADAKWHGYVTNLKQRLHNASSDAQQQSNLAQQRLQLVESSQAELTQLQAHCTQTTVQHEQQVADLQQILDTNKQDFATFQTVAEMVYQDEVRKFRSDLAGVRSVLDYERQEAHRREQNAQLQHQSDVAAIQQKHLAATAAQEQTRADAMVKQSESHKGAIAAVEQQHSELLADLRKEHEVAVADTDGQHAEAVASTEQQHHAALEAQEATHKATIAGIAESHSQAVVTLEQQHRDALAAQQETHQGVLADVDGQHHSAVANLVQSHRKLLATLERRYFEGSAAQSKEHSQITAGVEEEHSDAMALAADRHNAALAAQEVAHSETLAALEQSQAQAAASLERRYYEGLAALAKEHQTITDGMEGSHRVALASQSKQHQHAMAEAEAEHSRIVAGKDLRHQNAVQTLEQQHRAVVLSLEQQHGAALASLGQKHKEAVADVQQQHSVALASEREGSQQALADQAQRHGDALAEEEQRRSLELAEEEQRHQDALAEEERRHSQEVGEKEKAVQQLQSWLRETQEHSDRFEAQVVDLEEELRGTLARLVKAEKAIAEGNAIQTRLVGEKISLVNDQHELRLRIAELEGKGSYLKGQPHQWEQVPPSNCLIPYSQATYSDQTMIPQVRADTPRPTFSGDEPVGHLIAAAPQQSQPMETPTEPQLSVTAPALASSDPSTEPATAALATSAHPEVSFEPGTCDFSATAADGGRDEGQGGDEVDFDGFGAGQDLDSPAEDFGEFSYNVVDIEAGAECNSPSDSVISPDEEFGNYDIEAGATANPPVDYSTATSPSSAALDAGHLFAPAQPRSGNLSTSSSSQPATAVASSPDSSPSSGSTGAVTSSPEASGQSRSVWLQPCSLSRADWLADYEEEEEVSHSAAQGDEADSNSAAGAVPDSPDNGLSGAPPSSPAPTPHLSSIWLQPSTLSAGDWQEEYEEEEGEAATVTAGHDAEVDSPKLYTKEEEEEQSESGNSAAAAEEEEWVGEEGVQFTPEQSASVNCNEEEEQAQGDYCDEEEAQANSPEHAQGDYCGEDEERESSPEGHESSQGAAGDDAPEEGEEGAPQAITMGMVQQWCKEYQGIIAHWQGAYSDLSRNHNVVQQMYSCLFRETVGLQLLAWDIVNMSQRPDGSLPRFGESPISHMTMDMTHPKILQHRLFNMLDGNADGIIDQADVGGWMQQHVTAGTVTRAQVLDLKFLNHGGYSEEEHGVQSHEQVYGWLEGMVWGLMKEAFEPQSSHPDWKGISAEDFLRTGLGYHVTGLLCSPLEVIEGRTGAKRGVIVGAQYVRWGPLVSEAWSDLDATADEFQCFKH